MAGRLLTLCVVLGAPAPNECLSVSNEGAAFQPYNVSGINQTAANLATESILCGAAESSILRDSIGLPQTLRYQYAGNW